MNTPILLLEQASDISICGGKAASLAQLLQAGFQVPNGFVVTTDSRNIKEVEADVLKHFDALGNKYVAVRSSAVMEDGKTTSWAGQLETFLNVTRADLIEKIHACQQSGTSVRAKAYAKNNDTHTGAAAVLIQEMVQPETSGVAFSVHPVTNDTKTVVIEAVYGLGEALVSGQVTPDTYVSDKKSGGTLDSFIGMQTKKLVLAGLKNKWQTLSLTAEQKLSTADVHTLTKIVVKLESFFEYPVDIEWAKKDSTFYILQCRPITTLG